MKQKQNVIIISSVLLICLVVFLLWWFMPTRVNWLPKPKERYPDVVKEFGSPCFVDPRSGGRAVWTSKKLKNTPYDEIIIRDEEIPHCCPAIHVDFLSSAVCVEIKDKLKLNQVLGITKSIWYDQLKNQLWARCHFMGANVATLVLATDILLNKTEMNNKVPMMYKSMIMGSNDNYKQLTKRLSENVKALCAKPKGCNGKVDCSSIFSS